MASTLVLTGDVNLMNVADPEVPFRKIAGDLRAADVLFSNLECCLHLPSSDRATFTEGFFADPAIGGEALRLAGIHAVGIANNVNYGAANIMASLDQVPRLLKLTVLRRFTSQQALGTATIASSSSYGQEEHLLQRGSRITPPG